MIMHFTFEALFDSARKLCVLSAWDGILGALWGEWRLAYHFYSAE